MCVIVMPTVFLEQRRGEVTAGADAGGRIGDLAGIGFGIGDELIPSIDREAIADSNRKRHRECARQEQYVVGTL